MGNLSKGKDVKSLDCEERYIPSGHGGPDIRVRVFRPKGVTGELPGMLYIHGGGYILANPEASLNEIKNYIRLRPCIVIAPAYRLAGDAPFPAGFNDCYDAMLWMRDNTESLGIKRDKFIIAGHSAGGGMTAALTLKARDTEDIEFAFQLPIYPMIDHRQITESAKDNMVTGWNSINNKVA